MATILTSKLLRFCMQTRSGFRQPHNTRKIVRTAAFVCFNLGRQTEVENVILQVLQFRFNLNMSNN